MLNYVLKVLLVKTISQNEQVGKQTVHMLLDNLPNRKWLTRMLIFHTCEKLRGKLNALVFAQLVPGGQEAEISFFIRVSSVEMFVCSVVRIPREADIWFNGPWASLAAVIHSQTIILCWHIPFYFICKLVFVFFLKKTHRHCLYIFIHFFTVLRICDLSEMYISGKPKVCVLLSYLQCIQSPLSIWSPTDVRNLM